MSAVTLRPIETKDRLTLTRSDITLLPPNAYCLMAILAVRSCGSLVRLGRLGSLPNEGCDRAQAN